ncbi:hypothetical protein BASA83_007922 [Batrachochytrium salamandrivorans]|nr:hypothetical protein BASA83_007922 [Batrachochytrium salamandrivorans]
MKLQGVFMIIPLLAVVASGITIPSTDGYNAQQLEKRSDSEPDNNEPGDGGPRGGFAEESGGNEDDQSQVSGRHLEVTEQPTQNSAKLPNEMGKNKGGKSVGPSDSLKRSRRQGGTTNQQKETPPKSPGSGCGFKYLFTCKKS